MTPAAAALLVMGVGVVASGCGGGGSSAVAEHPSTSSSSAPAHDLATTTPSTRPSTGRSTSARPGPLRLSVALDAVDHLARDIGPRHATSPAYVRAVRWLAGELRSAGYVVHEQRFPVPGGVSWGVPVRAGQSVNVVATPPGFDPRRPYLVVAAHLDTVPVSPGAEDDGSGIGVLLMLARALSGTASATRLPVVLIGFGAEEPRGPTDADHHYGSRAYVARLSAAERRAVRGMLALDRVGVGTVVPVCAAGDDAGQAEVLRVGRRVGVPMLPCENRSSDHWSFVEKGMPGVRIGGTSYAGYHSPDDVPAVENPAQLQRTARLVLAWLR